MAKKREAWLKKSLHLRSSSTKPVSEEKFERQVRKQYARVTGEKKLTTDEFGTVRYVMPAQSALSKVGLA